ncbi:hypothetical protein ACIBHY_26295 [Nonomuraea sp. NPDC050547]|uniref:hypothetical protein n=1 Tax=Nonomuraea sp. NPDC050547 TaxID=3364368 RepID=UPI003798E74A
MARAIHDGLLPDRAGLLRAFLPRAFLVLAFLLVSGLAGGWVLAGRMLAPLTRITDATRHGPHHGVTPSSCRG